MRGCCGRRHRLLVRASLVVIASLGGFGFTLLAGCTGHEHEPAAGREAAGAGERTPREPAALDWREADTQRRAVTLRRIAALPDSDRAACDWADRASALADSLVVAGDVRAARITLERQRAIRQRLLGPEHEATAASLSALARLAYAQGEFARAHDLDLAALVARRHTLGEHHPDVAQSLTQLANDVKNSGGSWRQAMRLHVEALALRRELLGEAAPEVSESLMGIANMHRLMNHPDSASAVFADVLERRRRVHPPDEDAVASTLTAWSLVHTQASDWRQAEPLLREAVELRRSLDTPRPSGLELSLSTWGMTLRNLGRSAAAESALTECAALRESLRRGAEPGMGRAAVFDMSVYWQLAAAQLDQGETEAAWLSVERGSSRTLIESLSDRGVIDTLGMWRGALVRVQRTLAPDAAVIGWLELKRGAGREGYPFWCYCIRDHGPVRWHRVDGPPGDMWHGATDAVYAMKSELTAAAGWPLRVVDTTVVARLGGDLYHLRIAPLEGDLTGVRRLVVMSPDIMRGIPLESLADTAGRWLGDRFEISYTPSAVLSAMRHEAGRRRRAPAQWRALLVGDPAFGAVARAPDAATAAAGPLAAAWPRLGASRSEVGEIAKALPRSTVLLGADASEANLRRLIATHELSRYDLIHFATHAVVDDHFPGRSGLVLAESPRPATIDAATPGDRDRATLTDGFVTVDEITADWTLDARLVSLAGCRSALGPVSHVEGYIGFEQALLGAGAHALMLSLWRVDDRATALLMRRFYRNLVGADPGGGRMNAASALREAQRWLRDLPVADGSRPYRHPVYWAGIVLIGDPD